MRRRQGAVRGRLPRLIRRKMFSVIRSFLGLWRTSVKKSVRIYFGKFETTEEGQLSEMCFKIEMYDKKIRRILK